jgi:hypothetical protein
VTEVVRINGPTMLYPRPFTFLIHALRHSSADGGGQDRARILCLYDNAGEQFLPLQSSDTSPATQHLGVSEALLFLFDPTQDPRFRKACREVSQDPQVQRQIWSHRQDLVLTEAALRIRRHAGLRSGQLYHRRLVVVITKFDIWRPLLIDFPLSLGSAFRNDEREGTQLDCGVLNEISRRLRNLLCEHCPEVVAAAENFCESVSYLPVSATGSGPEINEVTGLGGFRPQNIKPMWPELPLLYALSGDECRLVPAYAGATD